MHIDTGTILISTPFLDNSIFEKTVIYISEYNENGASGFIINKLFPLHLNDLIEFRESLAFALHDGGPVEYEKLYFLHRRPDLIGGGIHTSGTIYLGGDFEQAVDGINSRILLEQDIKLFIGYCGWEKSQLEEEIAEGSWLTIDTDINQIIFADEIDTLWNEMYARWAN